MNPPAKKVTKGELSVIAQATLARKAAKKAARKAATQEPQVRHIPARELYPHPLLDRVGTLPAMIEREDKMGRRSGQLRDDHKERAEELSSEFAATSVGDAAWSATTGAPTNGGPAA